MSWIDWSIVAIYLAWIVWAGAGYGRKREGLEDYLLASRSMPWWAVGLSVMATQMSAITLIGTTGQAFDDGMRFVQFYLGLPLAMIILSITVVPFFNKAKVYTAYEYLERRFDTRTRSLTSFFFLVSRCLGVGVIISAPGVVLSAILGLPLWITVFAIGLTTTVYTMFGGIRAVTWTDVRQMVVIGVALTVVFIIILNALPTGVGLGDALETAGITDRTKAIDLKFDWNEKYTIWSGLIGGLFLMLSYFGCDQSQVQRYLTAKSVDEGRRSLMMNAVLKVPLQFGILLIGLMVFVYYHYVEPEVVFNPVKREMLNEQHPEEFARIKERYRNAFEERQTAAELYTKGSEEKRARLDYIAANEKMIAARKEALEMVQEGGYNDVNFVFPTFVTKHLPIGIVGLFIAAIFAAAMSSISSELNALSTATVIDFYRRHFRAEESDEHYLKVSRFFTLGWGLFACIVALYAANLGSLIEVVNKFGSFFYGSLLGVFVLAIGVKRATARGAFWGLLIGMAVIGLLNNLDSIASTWELLTGSQALYSLAENLSVSYLWYNVIGCLVVVLVGIVLGSSDKKEGETASP
ncbi:MAG: sodium:solute symporter [Chlorobi bacterium]|nr:sodium:solute symporter [Chlorobiota bacterium]